MKKKYVRVTYAGFFLFAEEVPHIHIEYIANQGGYRVISAGFWNLDDKGLAVCYGESISLRVKSRPDDTDALREFLGQNAEVRHGAKDAASTIDFPAVVSTDLLAVRGTRKPQNTMETQEKALDVQSVEDAKAKVSDIQVVGNGDTFALLCKASSKSQVWMKSAKAMEVPGGCVVQVTTQQGSNVAEALTFVPGVKIAEDINGGRKLVAL